MIDDVLGLVVLAIIAGVIRAAALGETLAPGGIVLIVAKALVFLVGAIVIGSYLSPRVFRHAVALHAKGIVLALSLGLLLRPGLARRRRGACPDRGCLCGGPGARGRTLRGPPQARRTEPAAVVAASGRRDRSEGVARLSLDPDAEERGAERAAMSDDLWYKDAVFYELHVKAFADSNGDGIGDFPGL